MVPRLGNIGSNVGEPLVSRTWFQDWQTFGNWQFLELWTRGSKIGTQWFQCLGTSSSAVAAANSHSIKRRFWNLFYLGLGSMPVYFKKCFQCLGHAELRQVVIWIVRLGPSQVEKGWPVSFFFRFWICLSNLKLQNAARCMMRPQGQGPAPEYAIQPVPNIPGRKIIEKNILTTQLASFLHHAHWHSRRWRNKMCMILRKTSFRILECYHLSPFLDIYYTYNIY